jgi:hypothetical protein
MLQKATAATRTRPVQYRGRRCWAMLLGKLLPLQVRGAIEQIQSVKYRSRQEVVEEMRRRGIPDDVIERMLPLPPSEAVGRFVPLWHVIHMLLKHQ